MRWAFATLMLIHGLLHLMGPAKAFGWAELPELAPVSRAAALLWLGAAATLLGTAALVLQAPRIWWVVGLAALVLSQAAIFTAWDDARVGTLANLILLLGVVYGLAAQGPWSFRAEYERRVEAHRPTGTETSTGPDAPRLTEADLVPLPEPIRRYLRATGSVGRPLPRAVRTTWRGRIRGGPEEPWMPFTAEQYNVVDPAARFFLMDARRTGLPVDVLHAFAGDSATMRVRLLSLLPMVDAAGPEMDQGESVTLFNDLALLAPATLAGSQVRWEPLDERSARGTYVGGAVPVQAVLHVNEAGELVDFVSDDRLAASPDGTSFEPRGWSTPVGGYRSFDGLRLLGRGEGRWHPADASDFVYIELELLSVEHDPGRGPSPE